MSSPLEGLVQRYAPKNLQDYENALKEILQELVLVGLARTDFFNRAAFYGGTALRIFHGLSRFSEDLDFTLLDRDPSFSLQSYFGAVRESLNAFGLVAEIEEVQKRLATTIESAFLKSNTRMHLLQVSGADRIAQRLPRNKVIRVKFEIDVQPAVGFQSEVRVMLPPLSASVRLLNRSSLFAGKLHAVLCRGWGNRVKGRDFYDMLWYVGQKVPVYLPYLQAKMVEGGQWNAGEVLTRDALLNLLQGRFEAVDFIGAAAEVSPFLHDAAEVGVWSKEFFSQAVDSLLVEELAHC